MNDFTLFESFNLWKNRHMWSWRDSQKLFVCFFLKLEDIVSWFCEDKNTIVLVTRVATHRIKNKLDDKEGGGKIIWKGKVFSTWKKKRFSVQVVLHTGAGK